MVETRRLNELMSGLADPLDLPDGDITLALSGGADSAAMALLLSSLDRRFRAIHVNHGLRDSSRLEKAARAVAEQIGITLDVVVIEIPQGASAEGQARGARYAAMLAELAPGEWLLTAHTLEDQAETVLMNLLRGSGPAGLAGIPPRSGRLIRPLLGASRSHTRELAALAGLPFFDDPTNLDPAIRRNVIRLEVLPALAARFNPRLIEALGRAASLLRSDETYLESAAGAIPTLSSGPAQALAIGDLWAMPRPLADRAVRRCLARVRPPYSGTTGELGQVWEVAEGTRRSALLSDGIEVTVEGALLVFKHVEDRRTTVPGVDLEVGTQSVGRYQVSVEHVDRVCRAVPLGPMSAIFDPEATLRARVDEQGHLVIDADSEPAWFPGERRLDVAWYRPGTSGYLSVFATEESGWT
jgi:tRNA(Ile)-lysidine synthase